jgi:hypothetical protein
MLTFSNFGLEYRRDSLIFPSKLQACLKALDPVDLSCLARTVCLSLPYGYYIGVDARKAIEELGLHFREASPPTSQAASAAPCPRLLVTHFTGGGRVIPSFLYHGFQPEEIPLYDSSWKRTGWLSATDQRNSSLHFPRLSPRLSFDFSGLEDSGFLDLPYIDFDSFLNDTIF